MSRPTRTITRADVVVTGLGAVTALGTGADTLHQRWLQGEVGVADGLARASAFDPESVMTAKEVRRSDRYTQMAVVAAEEALAMAGWGDGSPYDGLRVATILGTGIGGITTLESQFDVLRDSGPRRLSPLGVPMMMPNAAAANIAMRRGFHGPTLGTVSACAAGANAIGTALRMLQYGEVDAVIAGGSEAAITPYATAAFGGMGTLSEAGISRPFDVRRDGFILGEGAGVLVLERRAEAERRGATVLGELRGYAATVDAHHLTAPDPAGTHAAAAMTAALADADLQASDVAYVNAHGTSTPLNDRAEADAIRMALGPHASAVPISSTKSAIGHLLGAAGAVEAVATVMALRAGVAGATLGYELADPEIGEGLDIIAGEPRALPAGERVALSNSFGFGGHNAVLCFTGGDEAAL
jgi:3-oxoacyl-[acyl-carrier-protein] synthase II